MGYEEFCDLAEVRGWRVAIYYDTSDPAQSRPFALAVFLNLDERAAGTPIARAALGEGRDFDSAADSCLQQITASKLL